MIRVLVADDSATARALIVALLSAEADIVVVGEARNGREAVDMAERLTPNVVTMDIQMPVMDGFQATQELMTRTPTPIIIVSSSARMDDVELSLEATRAGALLVLPKPEGPSITSSAADQRYLVNMVRAMASVKVVRRHTAGSSRDVRRTPAQGVSRVRAGSAPRIVAIGASTGGPAALQAIFADLPRSFPLPILVVQHISPGFTGGLVHWLGGGTRMDVRVATFGETPVPGTIYVAPDDRHLGLRLADDHSLRLLLDASPPVGSFRPSASFLFRSVTDALGAAALSVILTGMGDDGVVGLRRAYAAGGHVIAQDEASSVIWGMPREAVRAGVTTETLPLSEIAGHLRELAS
ncbi:MAG: chemotaxis-specific protein-glutamate methyltransferase CheB [bacterium]